MYYNFLKPFFKLLSFFKWKCYDCDDGDEEDDDDVDDDNDKDEGDDVLYDVEKDD